MKLVQDLFVQGDHRWQVVARDPDRASHLIDTNEYLVTIHGESLLSGWGNAAAVQWEPGARMQG